MFIEHQISILESFLKDHVTLKTHFSRKISFAISGIKIIQIEKSF